MKENPKCPLNSDKKNRLKVIVFSTSRIFLKPNLSLCRKGAASQKLERKYTDGKPIQALDVDLVVRKVTFKESIIDLAKEANSLVRRKKNKNTRLKFIKTLKSYES